jgi:hypothetical protein
VWKVVAAYEKKEVNVIVCSLGIFNSYIDLLPFRYSSHGILLNSTTAKENFRIKAHYNDGRFNYILNNGGEIDHFSQKPGILAVNHYADVDLIAIKFDRAELMKLNFSGITVNGLAPLNVSPTTVTFKDAMECKESICTYQFNISSKASRHITFERELLSNPSNHLTNASNCKLVNISHTISELSVKVDRESCTPDWCTLIVVDENERIVNARLGFSENALWLYHLELSHPLDVQINTTIECQT